MKVGACRHLVLYEVNVMWIELSWNIGPPSPTKRLNPFCFNSGCLLCDRTAGVPTLALNVSIDLGPKGVEACLREARVGFMYAPRYHPAMKAMRSVRGALKTSCLLWGFPMNEAATAAAAAAAMSQQLSN
eukprot:1160740-Pelagomonas_calceolata.AAC.5